MSKLVTVLLPVYNSQDFLKESIESILKQTYTHFEFLIINDGSTDLSSSIVNSYTDPRIRFIDNPQNQGLIAVLNLGLELAKGEYIARMDADDISLPHRLSTQIDYLEAHPSVDVCGSFYKIIGEQLPISFSSHPENVDKELLFHCCLAHPTVVLRKSTFIQHALKFNPEYKHAEDYKLWLDISKVGKLANIPEILLHYRKHSQQSSALYAEIQKKNTRRVIHEKFDLEFPQSLESDFDLFFDSLSRKADHPIDKVKAVYSRLLSFSKKNTYLSLKLQWHLQVYTRELAERNYFKTEHPSFSQWLHFHKEMGWANKCMISKSYIKFVVNCIFKKRMFAY